MSWNNTSFRIDIAGRPRKCHICGEEIPTGEKLLLFNSNSLYNKNACRRCVNKINKELNERKD